MIDHTGQGTTGTIAEGIICANAVSEVVSVNVGWTVERFVEEQKEKPTKAAAKPSSMTRKGNGKTKPSQGKEANKAKPAAKKKK